MQEVVGRQAQEAGGIYIVVTDLHDCRAETNTIFKAIILQLKKKKPAILLPLVTLQ